MGPSTHEETVHRVDQPKHPAADTLEELDVTGRDIDENLPQACHIGKGGSELKQTRKRARQSKDDECVQAGTSNGTEPDVPRPLEDRRKSGGTENLVRKSNLRQSLY